MHIDAVRQRRVQPVERIAFADAHRPARRQGGVAAAIDDPAPGDHDRLARQHAFYAVKRRMTARRKLELEQFAHRPVPQYPPPETGGQQRLRFGSEGETSLRHSVIERLYAEGIPRQHQPAFLRIVYRQRIHATQPFREVEPVIPVIMQNRFAIRVGCERGIRQFGAQFDIVVNFTVRDQGRPAGAEKRLIARFQVDNREPRMDQSGIAGQPDRVTVRAAMGQCRLHPVERACIGHGPVRSHDSRDTAH